MTWQWQQVRGAPLTLGDITLTPEARVLSWQWGSRGGLIWNRPIALIIQRGPDQQRLPIVDLTRLAQITAAAVGILIGAVLGFLTRHAG